MVREMELYSPVMGLFKEAYFITSEVPLGPKRIDLVCASEDLGKIIAVEVKVKNWKKAIRQALTYQLCADETYVAIHQRYSNSIERQKFEDLGIGLIIVKTDKHAEIAIPAKLSQRKSHNYAILVKAHVAEKKREQKMIVADSEPSPSPLKFYLWYVTTERRYFEDLPDCYDGFIVNAHILAHYASAFSALSTRLNKPFFTIPDTHAFQLAPPNIFLDSSGGIRSSWEKLASSYGPLIRLILNQRRNLDVSDFLSTTGSYEQALYDLVANVMTFQKNRVPSALQGLARFFDIPVQEPEVTTFLVAPYFYFTSVDDPWYKISLEMARESIRHKAHYALFAVLCMSRGILLSDQAMSTILSDYSQLDLDGFLLWVGDFQEDSEPTPLLYGLRNMVNSLKGIGKKVINLHGGFFSLLLYHYGLDGLASGVCYKDSADPTEFPTGGPAGGPVPKYYIQEIKVKMNKIEAGLAIHDLPSLRCSCKICNGQVDYILDPATPEVVSREFMRRHFLVVRKKEKEDMSKKSLAQIASELENAYKTYEGSAHLVPTEHLKRWFETIRRS